MTVTAAMVKELRERTGAGMMECKKTLVEAGGDMEAAVELMRKSGQAKADKKAGRVAAEGMVAVRATDDGRRAAMVEVNCETDFVAKEEEFRAFVEAVATRALEEGTDDVDALAAAPVEVDGPTIDERLRELVARIGEKMTIRRVALVQAQGDRLGSYVHQGNRIGVLVDISGGDESAAKNLAMHVAWSNPLAMDSSGIPAEVLDKEKEIIRAQVADSDKPPEIQEKMIAGRLAKYLKEVTLLGQAFVKDSDQSVEKYLVAIGAGVVGFVRFEVGEGIEKKAENFAEEVMAQVRGG